TTNETYIVGRVHEDFDVHLRQEARLGEDEYAFENDDQLRLHAPRFGQAPVMFEIIDRQINRLPRLQCTQMRDEQIGVNRIRVIEVGPLPVIERQLINIAIVRIL